MTRDERQKECIRRWVKAGGNASIVACTGFGKTKVALDIIDLLVKKNPDLYVIVVVPTDFLKEQWEEQLFNRKLYFNCSVQIINSAIKQNQECDLLIQDECHLFASQQFKQVFQKIKYKLILCLTGTLERLDGKEEIIKKYAPVCDRITLTIAEKNGWVSHVNEYVVLLNVDLSEYNEVNKKFNSYFAFFNFDFKIGMACLQDPKYRNSYAKTINIPAKQLAVIAADWMRCLRVRKVFIQSHPKKIEIIRKILDARKDKKTIVFSATIKDAESIKRGKVLHSKQSKKDNKTILEEFNKAESGVICTSKALNQGVDVKGLSVGIIASIDSSKITKTQRVGRICRFEEGKTAEMFTLLIAGTQEVNWFKNSCTTKYKVISEDQLDDLLNGEEVSGSQFIGSSDINKRF